MYSFAGLIRRTPPPTFSDTAITDRNSDTTIFQLTGCGYPGLLDRENRLDMWPRWESNPRLPARRAPFPLGQAPRRRWACHPENCNKNAKCYKNSVLTFWVECNANCQTIITFGSNVKSYIGAKFRSAGKML